MGLFLFTVKGVSWSFRISIIEMLPDWVEHQFLSGIPSYIIEIREIICRFPVGKRVPSHAPANQGPNFLVVLSIRVWIRSLVTMMLQCIIKAIEPKRLKEDIGKKGANDLKLVNERFSTEIEIVPSRDLTFWQIDG